MLFSKSKFITSKIFVYDKNRHVGFVSNSTADCYEKKWVQLDLGEDKKFDTIRLYGAVGRIPGGPEGGEIPPGDGFPKRFTICVSSEADMTNSITVVDYTKEDAENPQLDYLECTFNEVSGRYIRLNTELLGRLSNYGCWLKLSQIEIMSHGCNISLGCKVTASDSVESSEEGFGACKLTDGVCEYHPGDHLKLRPALIFGKKVKVTKPIKKAVANITALGAYKLIINGVMAEDSFLSPGFTNYNKRLYYQVYDVTKNIQTGENIITAVLGDGWYRLRYRLDKYDQFRSFAQGAFDDGIPRLLMEINIEYANGSNEVIGTDSSWKCYADGPYRETSVYDGVVYDCKKKLENYADDNLDNAIESIPQSKITLTEQFAPLIKERFCVQPVKTWKRGNSIIVDFGTSIGGMCKIILSWIDGGIVRVRHASGIDENGNIYTENLWGALNTDTYLLDGDGEETFTPFFTFHGFRYAEITGLSEKVKMKSIEAVMICDEVNDASSLITSDDDLNELWKLIKTSYLACMKSALVDVADRDERWPWLGDCFSTQLYTLPYFFDVEDIYNKRMCDILDDQNDHGVFLMQAPAMQPQWAIGWSDTGALLPYVVYKIYGNKDLLKMSYPAICRYAEAIINENNGKWFFGDWLSAYYSSDPTALSFENKNRCELLSMDYFESCYRYRTLCIVCEIAEILEQYDDKNKYDRIKDSLFNDFHKKYVMDDGTCGDGSQSAYALALSFGIVPKDLREKAVKKMLDSINSFCEGKFSTGTMTTIELLKVLSDEGYSDVACKLVMQKEYPSYGYMIECGATALWERFDSFRKGIGYNPDPMNGLIHIGFCSVGEWVAKYIGGIYIDNNTIVINPAFPMQLTFSKFSWKTRFGYVSCNWKREGKKYRMSGETPCDSILCIRGQEKLLHKGKYCFEWTE